MNKLEFLNRAVKIVKMAMEKKIEVNLTLQDENFNTHPDCTNIEVVIDKERYFSYYAWKDAAELLDKIEKVVKGFNP